MHRQLLDEIAAFAVDAPPFTVGDVVKNFGRFAVGYEFKRTEAAAVAEFLAVTAAETVLIDEDVTWRDDAVRQLLADPVVMQVTDLDIDLAPELKELIPPAEAKWIEEEIERLGSELLSLAYANGLRILTGQGG